MPNELSRGRPAPTVRTANHCGGGAAILGIVASVACAYGEGSHALPFSVSPLSAALPSCRANSAWPVAGAGGRDCSFGGCIGRSTRRGGFWRGCADSVVWHGD